jgi:hypothetical protein
MRRWAIALVAGATVIGVVAGATVIALAGAGRAADGTAGRGLTYRCTLETTTAGAGEITVTIRLRTNGARDEWRVRLFHDDELVFKRVRVTNALGNLQIVRVEPNLPGRDAFEARTRHLGSGTRCAVDASI